LTTDLTIDELSGVLAPITHQDDTLSILLALIVLTLVLEERVGEGVSALAISQLSNWVDAAHITVLRRLVHQITFDSGGSSVSGWAHILFMILDRDLLVLLA